MRVRCERQLLNKVVAGLARVVPTHPMHPVLGDIHVKAQGGGLTLSAFDLSLGMEHTIEAEVLEEGEAMIAARTFAEAVPLLPDQTVVISAEYPKVTIDYGLGRFELQGLSATEYPRLPRLDQVDPIRIPAPMLYQGLRTTMGAASTDESRLILTGVHFQWFTEGLELAGTDGHRLAIARLPNVTAPSFPPITVPTRALKEIATAIAKRNDEVALRCDLTQAIFDIGEGLRITIRLLDGRYPEYRAVLPKTWGYHVTVDRAALLETLERVAVLAPRPGFLTKIELNPTMQNLRITANAQNVGDIKETLPAKVEAAEALAFGCNARYLIDCLRTFDDPLAVLALNGTDQGIGLSPYVDPEGGNPHALQRQFLIMPIRLKD